MRRALLRAAFLGLSVAVLPTLPIRAAELSDPVPDRSGIKYRDLVKLVMPDIMAGDYNTGTLPAGIRSIVPPNLSLIDAGKGGFDRAESIPIRTGGKDRLLLMLDFQLRTDYDETFALLLLIGFDGSPAVLDIANVSMGMMTSIDTVVPVGANESVVLTTSQTRSEPNLFSGNALILVRDDRFELIDDIWTTSSRGCSFTDYFVVSVKSAVSTARFGDVTLTVTRDIESEQTDGCEGEDMPDPVHAETAAAFHWNESQAKYLPDSNALDVFAP